jgi:hypothetical protein
MKIVGEVSWDLVLRRMERKMATHGLYDVSVRTDPIADLITVSVSSMMNFSRALAASVMLRFSL